MKFCLTCHHVVQVIFKTAKIGSKLLIGAILVSLYSDEFYLTAAPLLIEINCFGELVCL